jgi:hypothetical protein
MIYPNPVAVPVSAVGRIVPEATVLNLNNVLDAGNVPSTNVTSHVPFSDELDEDVTIT